MQKSHLENNLILFGYCCTARLSLALSPPVPIDINEFEVSEPWAVEVVKPPASVATKLLYLFKNNFPYKFATLLLFFPSTKLSIQLFLSTKNPKLNQDASTHSRFSRCKFYNILHPSRHNNLSFKLSFISELIKFQESSYVHDFNNFFFSRVALVASHAAVPPEKYWNSMLPNTPMPKALSDLLQPGWYFESERTSLASFH
ncbi:hypothetical protein CFP56_009495 [Quercus suber]|uniref:Uncharacterized protein n=1 Tax=Quercus suber TaxID=58331 RepID=A0AAW0M6Z4_QUESU